MDAASVKSNCFYKDIVASMGAQPAGIHKRLAVAMIGVDMTGGMAGTVDGRSDGIRDVDAMKNSPLGVAHISAVIV